MKKGEIYYINNSPFYIPTGSEVTKDRPGVIVSGDELNDTNEFGVIIIPLTSKPKFFCDFHTTIHSSGRPSTVLTEQMKYIDRSRLGDYIGQVTEDEMAEIEKCINKVLGINNENNSCENTEEIIRLKKELADSKDEIKFIKDECNKQLLAKETEIKVYKEVYEKMTELATNK